MLWLCENGTSVCDVTFLHSLFSIEITFHMDLEEEGSNFSIQHFILPKNGKGEIDAIYLSLL